MHEAGRDGRKSWNGVIQMRDTVVLGGLVGDVVADGLATDAGRAEGVLLFISILKHEVGRM